ncbi:ribulokinase [Robiginitalea sp. M366]|uniref:ribulokinase n=1 Tax=Robiginitalea aestuariiviva TaxID=3036903 RepID=UPI00240D15F4|nr:ribulokinase [Robiginitalea aestuariiviva]MDG1572015.1 ribulokinase [Robiginitalea aestuariiviva]
MSTRAATFTLGLDFGTDSVRAVLVGTADGAEHASAVAYYPRWAEGQFCDPAKNRFRQHPLDHQECMVHAVRAALSESGLEPAQVRGLCVDTTGSSPLPLQADGTPLALTPAFAENPNAMVVLWKDHTAIAEAEALNQHARTWGGPDYTRFVGGIYSSEWFWAKVWHVAASDPAVREAAWTWMEHCDWLTFLLTGGKDPGAFRHSRCAAGHKAMWHASWGGLPPANFLAGLHPYLGELRGRLYEDTYTSDQPAGTLCQKWAEQLGLEPGIAVATGTFDAHAGAVGAAIAPQTLVRVMGTSTCDILVSEDPKWDQKAVRGICGQVDGSVLPGLTGLEAGQSAFGDLLAWYRDLLLWPLKHLEGAPERLRETWEEQLLPELSRAAAALPSEAPYPLALDWINGRRTPDANQQLKSAITGLSLGSGAPEVFRALVEAICLGSRKIVERFEQEGVPIREVLGIGGVARKSPYIMQTLADVLGRRVRVAASDQTPALGAAIYAAVAAGLYPDVASAAQKMGSPAEATYEPRPERKAHYDARMAAYERLGHFVETQTQYP